MASSATPPASAAGAGTAQAVKELQIDLDPADLGAVSVTMRLAGGKLSIVMEVATPSTLKAIEGERDAIAERLGLTSQSLEALIIKPAATNAESDNAQSQKPGSQEYAQFDSNGESRGNGRSSSRRESAANRGDPGAAARQPASRRGFGDLVV
jgi:chemotaxis protein MotD